MKYFGIRLRDTYFLPNKKNIESLDLTPKSKAFKALTWKLIFGTHM